MLPMEFDHRMLSSLPLPDDAAVARVQATLKAVVERRVLSYFHKHGLADEVTLARIAERHGIARLEDDQDRIQLVSLLTQSHEGWTVHIHERIFDYLAFGLPADPRTPSAELSQEARRGLAVAELLLRHSVERMIHPGRASREVILSDGEFAMERRELDPGYYGTLREALSDPAGGLKGTRYLRLFELFERGESDDELLDMIIEVQSERLALVPVRLLRSVFHVVDRDLKARVIDACYRISRNTSFALVQRARAVRKVLWLFTEQLSIDEAELAGLFTSFTERWGAAVLLQELEIPDRKIEVGRPEALLGLFVSGLRRFAGDETAEAEPDAAELDLTRRPGILEPHEALPDSPRATLKDRIESARKNAMVPRSVLEVIDRNQAALHGHSGAKYTEFVDVLLSVPWGKLHRIAVGPKEFADGLNTTHYSLHRPKDILADFFANLIWRYGQFDPEQAAEWRRNGSAFLFVGPPGVGKTSLAISVARNLGIPHHKVSLGGMRDEADLRGHGFTYEGSKPGAIVQGLLKMGVMNGMFIFDEADKTEAFAIATLLEILDSEQNHLFHDKYTQTTVDIDLSNCHFILTANTLETVPAPVVDRCQVVRLDRYSVDEKISIAQRHVIPRIRKQHGLDPETIFFEPGHEEEHLRHLVQAYTHEAGVRQLEWTLRTLFLRLQRREIFDQGVKQVTITHQRIKASLEEPSRPGRINEDDRVGEVLGLGVDVERGVGGVIPVQATRIRSGLATSEGAAAAVSMVHATGNIEKVMDESRKVATTALLHCARELGIDPEQISEPVHLHFMGGSSRKDGPSAGAAIALALASLLTGRRVRRDVAVTGEVDTRGRVIAVGGMDVKLETAASAGCRTAIIPRENLHGPGGIERFPEALKRELQILTFEEWASPHRAFEYARNVLQVVAVEHILEAQQIACIDNDELKAVEERFVEHAETVAASLTARRSEQQSCPVAVLVKDASELAETHFLSTLCEHCSGCHLLIPSEGKQTLLRRIPHLAPCVKPLDFDASSGNLVQALESLIEAHPKSDAPARLAVIAPFFALKEAALGSDQRSAALQGAWLFANNYAAQGVKLKGSKPLLNRTYCRLLTAGEAAIESCPFVTRHEGVFAADLSPIPEKYRLDLKRAEEILSRCLDAWLLIVETALADAAT